MAEPSRKSALLMVLVPHVMKARIREAAARRGISVSAAVREAVQAWMEREES